MSAKGHLTSHAVRSAIFAANRATGHIALGVDAVDGRTRRTRVHEEGSLRVRFPHNAAGALEAVIVNTAGGMTGGDRFSIELSVAPRANLIACTAAAEKIYRSTGADAEMRVRLAVGAEARLAWLPQETILFDRSRLRRNIDIDLAASGSLFMAEAVVFGRIAMDETMNEGCFADRWRVRRAGKLVFADNARLDGRIAETLDRPAVAAGGKAIATVLIAPCLDGAVEAVRTLEDRFAGEVGISAWNSIALMRFCARDGAVLRHDLIIALAALNTTVPRLWLQ